MAPALDGRRAAITNSDRLRLPFNSPDGCDRQTAHTSILWTAARLLLLERMFDRMSAGADDGVEKSGILGRHPGRCSVNFRLSRISLYFSGTGQLTVLISAKI